MVKWESIAVFHAAGDELEPDALLARYSVQHATTYKKGEPAVLGRTHTLSGFKIDLGAFQSKAALEEGLLAHLREYSGLYRDLTKDGGRASLGIGLSVFSKEPRTVTFSPGVLTALADLGITLHVTGYPCADDVVE